ncbi:NAD(+)/NADH kinase [Ruminococcus flavefaciens]|uniref:NAD(+)/NADH kinase n=1 Tax=Ruminococcus flavefaciens TaxID=1265 RepID=UPI0026EA754A|nr:NAD(+)/NADH kinase [Ruminococcus flavefaciens]MDD7517163.1 NAD(+)/NADH kinase [Ruminococcus flavefaciens]MDY5690079.1 NAD(+)/NADH kinase [Ruminococcus flavefaciens]
MKAALYPNFQKPNALSCAREVCDVLAECGIEVSVSEVFRNDFSDKSFVKFEDIKESAKTSDFVLAIGGDGTILRCAKLLIGSDTKLLGINTGTLGFMAGLEADQLDKLSLLTTGEYELSQRMTLDVVYHGQYGNLTATVLNEVSARSGSFRICDFEVYADEYLVGRYRADGVLFSTPSGSTAYALSAGGPVIEPDLECIEMTLICPHSLFSRATMFSPGRKLRMKDTTIRDDSMVINVDGEHFVTLGNGGDIEICRGKNDISFINLIGNSFHESLCKKMCKPIK